MAGGLVEVIIEGFLHLGKEKVECHLAMRRKRKQIRWKRVIILLLFAFLSFLMCPWLISTKYNKEIYSLETIVAKPVAIVFGALVYQNGQPSDILADRLDSAAELYTAGLVQAILVSGDNSVETYNEPEVMHDYLVGTHGIPDENVVIDFAGRRTYDTCARAASIWGLNEAILVTQEYHLPRALYTCEAWGISSTGYSATRQMYVKASYYVFREWLASYKAVLDVWFLKPDFIAGEPELDFIDL
jgi:SanA protein